MFKHWQPRFECRCLKLTFIQTSAWLAFKHQRPIFEWALPMNMYYCTLPYQDCFICIFLSSGGPTTCTRALAPKNINSIVEILFFFYIDKLLFNCISRCSQTSKRCGNMFRYWSLCRLYNNIKANL